MAPQVQSVFLEPIEQTAGLLILRQLTDAPVYVDRDFAEGSDWFCGGCRRSLLASGVVPAQFWGVGFRCHLCGNVSAVPTMPEWRLPPQRRMLSPEGEIGIGTTVEGRDVALVAERAWRERLAERPRVRVPGELDPANLRLWGRRARALIGEDAFDRLTASAERGRRSTTPPRTPHPLTEMIEALRMGEAQLALPEPQIDLLTLADLHLTLGLLERWQGDAGFPSIRSALVGPHDFLHGVITLAAASYLRDEDNAVYLYESPGSRRAADLWIDISPGTSTVAEVKTPAALHRPTKVPTPTEARRLLQELARSAGMGSCDQLAPGRPGVLIIGGWHLADDDLSRLHAEAARLLTDRPRWTHVMAFVLVVFGLRARGLAITPGGQLTTTSESAFSGAQRPLTRFHEGVEPRDSARFHEETSCGWGPTSSPAV